MKKILFNDRYDLDCKVERGQKNKNTEKCQVGYVKRQASR